MRHAPVQIVEHTMARSKSRTRRANRHAERRAELGLINLNAAGVDVGAKVHFVAVPVDRNDQPVRRFGAFTADLYQVADWLSRCGIVAWRLARRALV